MELENYLFFKELPDHDLNRIRLEAKPVFIDAGEIIFYQGEQCDHVLFLKSGKMKVYMQPEHFSDLELTLYEISAGEQCLVNTISTISQSTTLASAKAIETIEAWSLSREKMLWLLNNSQPYREFKIELCNQRLANLLRLVNSLKFDTLEQRIMNWLYVQGKEIINVTHEKLANTLGVTRESISRNLKNLEKNNYVRLDRGKITVVL